MRWNLVFLGLVTIIGLLAVTHRDQLMGLISKSATWVWSIMTFWRPAIAPLHDPMNDSHGEHNVGYVSRWALVEFGVECTRCGEPAATRLAFNRIRRARLPDGSVAEVIDCPSCHTALIASPTTEKLEHKLDTTDARVRQHLATFARKRHALSPVSPMEAHSIRNRLKVSELAAVNPLEHVAYAQLQANAELPGHDHIPIPSAVDTKAETDCITKEQPNG